MKVVCPDPEFVWIPEFQWWSACVHCRRMSWSHEQADPLQDFRNYLEQVRRGLPPGTFPPTMRPVKPLSGDT